MTPSFFVVGLPRSGTTWLSRLYAEANADTLIAHEPYRADFSADQCCAFHPWKGKAHAGRRQALIDARIVMKGEKHARYGEITPRMRYWSKHMEDLYPDAAFVHLVRDPRATVVSMMNYGYYGAKGLSHRLVSPERERWSSVKRTAWAWAFGHNRVRAHVSEFVRLEDLLVDYAEIERLSALIGCECSRERWERERAVPKNPSQRTTPEYRKWPPSWRRELWGMVEEEATCYGYAADG